MTGKLVTGDHGGDGHAVASEVTECFEPAGAERLEGGFLEETCVEGVSKVDEVLKMLQSERGGKGGTAEGLEEFVEGVCPESDDDIVLCWDDAQGGGYGRGEGDFHQVVHHVGESGVGDESGGDVGAGSNIPFVVGYKLEPFLLFEFFVGNIAGARVQENAGVVGVVVGVFCEDL